MERDLAELAPDPQTFGRHFSLVQDYVQSRPGSRAALMDRARQEPEAMTMSIVALGAVLLDIAAGAFRMTPEQMLEKVGDQIHQLGDGEEPAP